MSRFTVTNDQRDRILAALEQARATALRLADAYIEARGVLVEIRAAVYAAGGLRAQADFDAVLDSERVRNWVASQIASVAAADLLDTSSSVTRSAPDLIAAVSKAIAAAPALSRGRCNPPMPRRTLSVRSVAKRGVEANANREESTP